MKRQTKNINNHELLKKIMKCQAKRLHLTPEPPVVILKEMDCIQKLAIMYKLVDELRIYIEYREMAQFGNDPIFLDMDEVAKKVGMGSRKELKNFLDARAG